MTDKKLDQLIEKTIIKLEDTKNNRVENINIVYKVIKKLIPSDIIYVFALDEEQHALVSMLESDRNVIVHSLNKKSLLTECFESREVLFSNDIHRYTIYNEEVDGFSKKDIVKILTLPICNIDRSFNPVGVIQIGIEKGFYQFVQKDIDSLVYFIDHVKKYIFDVSDTLEEKHNKDLMVCQASKIQLQEQRKEQENYFASTIHDIRTPMNAVIGFMELMLLEEVDVQKREYIDATLKSSEQIIFLINNVLDTSKIANGKMDIEEITFSPLEGIRDIAKLFYNSMKQKNIYFIVDLDPLLPAYIFSDLHRINQIINNLLSNAIKFTPEEGTVTLKTIYNKEKDELIISVIDTGIGIVKERQKSIFDAYIQETNSTSRKYGGTGLGLSIAQQLSILLKGSLTLQSVQGKGSEFILSLPCNTSSALISQISDDALKQKNSTNYKSLHGKSAMVIDDSVVNLKLMVEILNQLHLDVTTCDNAKEALDILENKVVDIIFIDQNMPLMNGDEAIVQIRKKEKKKKEKPTIIYGLTGETNKDVIEKIMNAGANAIFEKPIHVKNIFNVISQDISKDI